MTEKHQAEPVFYEGSYVSSIVEIKRRLYYPQSYFESIKLPSGQTLGTKLREHRLKRKVPWIPKPGFKNSCCYRGDHVLQVAADAAIEHDARATAVAAFYGSVTASDVYDLMIENRRHRDQKKWQKHQQENERLRDENSMLRQRLSKRAEHQSEFHDILRDTVILWLSSKKVPKESLRELDFRRLTGIYLLFCDGAVVYVGQSIDIAQRISAHRREKQGKFDSVRYFECGNEQLNDMENFLIALLNPPLNGAQKWRDAARFSEVVLSHLRKQRLESKNATN